jgi:hypothetical protein
MFYLVCGDESGIDGSGDPKAKSNRGDFGEGHRLLQLGEMKPVGLRNI